MIVTTTPTIEGYTITKYLGVVNGETIFGANALRDIKASFTDFFGGRSGAYEKTLQEARESAMQEMIAAAQSIGANAVVGIDIDYETIGANGSMLMVAVSGTAVKIS